MTAMTEGDLSAITLTHWQIALTTGTAVGVLGVLLSFGKAKKIQSTRLGFALVALVGTFVADLSIHPTHFGAFWTEALVTAIGASALAFVSSYLPIDRLKAKVE